MTVGIVTVSDMAAQGRRTDDSGRVIADLVGAMGAEVAAHRVVPDEVAAIQDCICRLADELRVDLILTTGGTGLGPRDVTPEATLGVMERAAPGIAEAMRAAGMAKTPRAMLSRAVAGVRGRSLIINLPGSPRGVRESLEAVLPVLPHGVQLLRGEPTDH